MGETNRSVQRRKPTEVRRREIIEAGMHILASEGARRFTAEHLAESVGLTSGTIFRHFDSMEEILDAIVDRIEDTIFANFPPQADDPLDSLRQFFEARVDVISSHPEISKLLLTDGVIPNGDAGHRQQRLQEFKRRSRRFVTDRLNKAHAQGLLAKDTRPEVGGILVLGSIFAIAHAGTRTRGTRDVQGLARRTWELIERSLRKSV